ncbi:MULTISPECIES: DoxX family protein [Amycolatopsis]|uniref:DoxX family protein n=1 Tax=Amycolatopsis albidoflavus TaxID=102226 RepID=A0ABW5HSI5_9PSEU
MPTVALILSIVLAALFVAGGAAKLIGIPAMRADAERFGLSYPGFRLIGLLECAGGTGLLTGSLWKPLPAFAAVGLLLLLAGAVAYHVRAKDPVPKTAGPVVVGLLVAVAGVLQIAG